MKHCLCCGAEAHDDTDTCPSCGEGSWSASDGKKAAKPKASAKAEPKAKASDGKKAAS